MNGDTPLGPGPELDACGCCDAGIPDPEVANRPGLPALAYRLGTHPSFLRRMLAHLPGHRLPDGDLPGGGDHRPLAGLTTRAPDDPSIALLDAWAAVADVLTFYQERIANEGFLGTATERRSVLELARTIGYELGPGVAASTVLAFSVDDSPGSPGVATVPAGTKVQSLPAKGELPQTFETSSEITARAAWNALRPRLSQPQPLDPAAPTAYVSGQVTDLRPGATVLFVEAVGATVAATVKRVTAVTFEDALARTRLDLDNPPKPPPSFTYGAGGSLAVATTQSLVLNQAGVQHSVVAQSWTESGLAAFLSIQGWDANAVLSSVAVARRKPPGTGPVAVGGDIPPAQPGLYRFRVRAAPFGHNAPRHSTLTGSQATDTTDWDAPPHPITRDSNGVSYSQADFFLERVVPDVVAGGWVVLDEGATVSPFRVARTVETSLAEFAISARATGAVVAAPGGADVATSTLEAFHMRAATVHAGSQPLELADLPIGDDLGRGTAEERQLTLDTLVLGLAVGQPLVLSGERADLGGVVASEAVVLSEIVHRRGLTTMFFTEGLTHPYVRATVTLSANAVDATHGETAVEVLGSGDGTRANQRFTLRKPPLTHVAASTPSGARSTLEVRANGLLWEQAPTFVGLDGRAERYLVRIDDDAGATVVFGDGERGARPPSGVENVTAVYRSGIGFAGQVAAGSLTLLQTRPAGVRGVTNPVAASGADDPETLGNARQNAPLTVLTLDRIVSLRDFEDFARAFSGVGKAQAVELHREETLFVHLTVAAADGSRIEPASELFGRLVGAIALAADPTQRFRVDPHQPHFFDVTATVVVDPRHQPEVVRDAVRAAVLAAFSFPARAFGQPVAAAEVIAVVHGVPGVVATDLDRLARVDDPAGASQTTPPPVLAADRARLVGADVLPAQLLLVNPAGVSVGEMAP